MKGKSLVTGRGEGTPAAGREEIGGKEGPTEAERGSSYKEKGSNQVRRNMGMCRKKLPGTSSKKAHRNPFRNLLL